MSILRALMYILFLPGSLVLAKLGITLEEDKGILRSFINACFWGAIALIIALNMVE